MSSSSSSFSSVKSSTSSRSKDIPTDSNVDENGYPLKPKKQVEVTKNDFYDDLKKKHRQDMAIGSLIVRVVQAKSITSAFPQSFFFKGSSNPYVIVAFEGQHETTKVLEETLDPQWPRQQMFFDVKMPAFHAECRNDVSNDLKSGSSSSFCSAEPHLHIRVMHRFRDEEDLKGYDRRKSLTSKLEQGNDDLKKPIKDGTLDPDDLLLGETFINMVDLVTARCRNVDEWFPLDKGGAIRLSIDYDFLEPHPNPGDLVRLLGFGSPEDLWPLPVKQEFIVEEYIDPHKERMMVSYETVEGWRCSVSIHRHHVISVGRHNTIVNQYKESVLDGLIKFMDTPLMDAFEYTLDKAQEEGIGAASKYALQGLKKGANRWLNGGFGTVFSDLQMIVGLDGVEEDQKTSEGSNDANNISSSSSSQKDNNIADDDDDAETNEDDAFEYISRENLDKILCPITGMPMNDPVVAADGHTYERTAIERWIQDHDTSPLTGSTLETKVTFRNFKMVETIANMKVENQKLKLASLVNEDNEETKNNEETGQTNTSHQPISFLNESKLSDSSIAIPENQMDSNEPIALGIAVNQMDSKNDAISTSSIDTFLRINYVDQNNKSAKNEIDQNQIDKKEEPDTSSIDRKLSLADQSVGDITDED